MYFQILVIGRVKTGDPFCKVLEGMNDVQVEFTSDINEGLAYITRRSPHIVILDGKVIQSRGISIISQTRSLKGIMKIFVVAKCPTVEMAVGTIKAGADEFFANPPDVIKFRSILKDEVESWRLKAFGKEYFMKQRARYDFSNIYGESKEIKKVLKLIRKIIPSRTATVMIRGDTGTGKGLIARAIHYNSDNLGTGSVERPFVEINCTAIPDNLLESELFGYEKGAFTDAKSTKKGLFELADGGTIFLDEIGHMNQNLQLKLLKVVEEKSFRRLGGTKDIRVDVRILAGTNKDLEAAMRESQFREDLYYRLNVFTIRMPLLRERGRDIELLARHFLEVYNREHHRNIIGFTGGAIDLMMRYRWPGNVRELKNAIERAVLMADGEWITREYLPIHAESNRGDHGVDPEKSGESRMTLELNGVGIPLETIEKEVVKKVLKLNRGNRSKTARILKISRPRLLRMIKKYSIE